MAENKKYIILILFVFIFTNNYAQLSPGDLSKPHAKLEGLTNCTECHELGKKVSNKKCLDCHKEIKKLINQEKGYHSSSEVIKKDCFVCHSDHHGRKFEMIMIDENLFDHDKTGYILEGKHESTDCRKCHEPDKIEDKSLKNINTTFLGLDDKCISCHDDYHQETLSTNDCLSCHDMDAFRPATEFDHNDTEYILLGKHKDVDCKECHKKINRNGKEFQEFAGIEYTDCKSCHEDVHNNQLKGKCSQCHSEKSFSAFKGAGNFNHNVTGFTLKGAHKKTDCFECHTKTQDPKLVFKDKIKTSENNCVECHTDNHKGKYGKDCATCHSENSFLSLKSMDIFDHTVADYPLEGMHLQVDCKECHKKRFSTPIEFAQCKNCHDDYHNKEFDKNGVSPDCKECHSLNNGFDYSLYTLEQHQETDFPLEGAHNATPCYSCHVSEEKWTFKNIGNKCTDCHNDIHKNYISNKYYPDNSCISCHSNEAWDRVEFDHKLTGWPLQGKHQATACKSCHFNTEDKGKEPIQMFKNLKKECSACHENIHEDQFAIEGKTDCNRCHNPENWFPKKFDHNKTAFPLKGKHAEIECKECHISTVKNDKTIINYKIGKTECIDCHK